MGEKVTIQVSRGEGRPWKEAAGVVTAHMDSSGARAARFPNGRFFESARYSPAASASSCAITMSRDR